MWTDRHDKVVAPRAPLTMEKDSRKLFSLKEKKQVCAIHKTETTVVNKNKLLTLQLRYNLHSDREREKVDT